MNKFSKEEVEFFESLAKESRAAAKVPRSISCAQPGDFVVFEYTDSVPRLVLITKPIVKRPGTGNLLLTGFVIDRDFLSSQDDEFGPAQVMDLYNQRGIPENSFRTYNMAKFRGDLVRIRL